MRKDPPHPWEPQRLRGRDVVPAWATLLTGGAYGVRKSRTVQVLTGLLAILGLIAGYATGWQPFLPGVFLVLAVTGAALLAVPGCVLLVNSARPARRVWVSPGARAVVTARRTKDGWRPDNASARPVRHRVAAPLLAQVCAFADATGAVLSTRAANKRVATVYQERYGFEVCRSASGRPRVTRYPQPATTSGQPPVPD